MSDPVERARQLAHVEPLWNLEDKVDPQHTAVVVIDVQNDFCAAGGMMHREGLDVTEPRRMAERLPDFLEVARAAGVLVVFARNEYSTDANSYLSDVWLEQATRRRVGSYTTVEVCKRGEFGWEFYEGIEPQPEDPIVTKHRFGAFEGTDLELILRSHGIRTLVMTGVATNVCVETTARQAFLKDFYVVFTSDGTATYSAEDQASTLRNVDRYFGEIATLERIKGIWLASTPTDSS